MAELEKNKIDTAYAYWLLCILKAILLIIDYILDLATGCSVLKGHRSERKTAFQADRSAHIVNVRWRAALNWNTLSGLHNFIWSHDSYVDPCYVVQNKNVVLYGIDETRAYFSVTEKSQDLLDIKEHPFLFMSQLRHTKKLMIMSHSAFIRLAKSMGDYDCTVSVINMTGRSGSTLLCQMVDQLPNTRVLSEPWSLVYLNYLYQNGHISRQDNLDLIKAGMRVLCKREPGENFEHILIKMCPLSGNQFELYHKLIPGVKLFLNDRHPMKKYSSFRKIFSFMNKDTIFERWGFLWRNIWYMSSTPLDDPTLQAMRDSYWRFFPQWGDVEQLAFTHAGLLAGYFKNPDIYKQVILYEELLTNPEEVIGKMFAHMGMNTDHVSLALEALNHDSQIGLKLAERGSFDQFALEETTKKNVDKIYKDFGVPISCGMTKDEFMVAFR